MNKVLFVAAVVLALCGAAMAHMSEPLLRSQFERFEHQYKKTYADSLTREARYQIFRTNLLRADQLNRQSGTVAHGITRFLDMTPSELSHFLTFKRSDKRVIRAENMAKPVRRSAVRSTGIPASFDWREHNAVTPVRDQGQCGSCWAFSATEQVESAMLLKYANASTKASWLAPQQIVDCDVGASDYGCNGGDTITAFDYLVKAGGFMAEADYPYRAADLTCKFKKEKAAVKVTGWEWAIPACQADPACTNQDENALATSMTTKGPASICVGASNDWFSYTGPAPFAGTCDSGYNELNHCVQLVGLTKTSDSAGYWIVRNSWGTSWGANGYIYLPYGSNSCGVADEVTYVTVA